MAFFKIQIDHQGPIEPGEVLGAGRIVDAETVGDARWAQLDWLKMVNARRAERNEPLMIPGRVYEVRRG